MKTLVLGANEGFWHAPDRAYERDIISGIEAWVFAFDGDHCNTLEASPELIDEYDLIIGNTNGSAYRPKLLSLQNGRRRGIRWVSLIEGCATEYLAPDSTLKRILDGSDLVNVINRHTLEFFRSCTTARCEYIGIPYPAANIRKQFPPGNRRDVWTPSNFYNARASCSSVLAALPVTNRLGWQIHGFMRKQFTKKRWQSFLSSKRMDPKSLEPPCAGLLNSVHFHKEMGMSDYFQTLSQSAYAFVNLDHRYTWARDVLDCASLQIPCIATRATGHVEDFFPALTIVNEFAVREAAELLDKLYSDEEFYRRCAHVPVELLEPLSHENIKKKLLEALNS
jgi:hypothetical protein